MNSRSKKETSPYQHFVGICLLLGLFIPHTSQILMLINPILCVTLFLITRKQAPKNIRLTIVLMCAIIFISLFHSTITQLHDSTKYLFASFTLLLLLICFPFVNEERIPDGYFYVAIGYILFSQIIYLCNLPYLTNLLETIYPIGDDYENYYNWMTESMNTGNIFNYRLGGIYRNANQSARYVCLISAAFITENHDKTLKENISFVLLAFVSIILTGSRTGLVVFSLLIFLFIYKSTTIPKNTKRIIYFCIIVFVLPLFIAGNSNVRGLNVSKGMEDSAKVKWRVLMNYLSQDNTMFHLLFGNADPSTFQPSKYRMMKIFDSEYGELIYDYGFLGFFTIIFLFIQIFKWFKKPQRLYFIILLWAITSTILLSYRMSFVFMLLTSHFASEGWNKKIK